MKRWMLSLLAGVGVVVTLTVTYGARKGRVMIEEVGKRLDVKVDGKLFTSYHFSAEQPRPFFHPVVGPFGDSVVRGYPVVPNVEGETKDHVHHKGHWFTHGDVSGVDFWADGRGRIVHRAFEKVEGGEVGYIRERNDWIAPDGKKVLEEVRDIKIMAFSGGSLFDWHITLKATEGDVKMGDTKEGSFAIRVAETMKEQKGGRITNAAGKVSEKEAWGKQAAWCDYSGTVNGKTVGVTLFDHPKNFRQAYYHTRAYGLHAANPFGTAAYTGDKTKDGAYTIPRGQSLTLRYALYVHPGDVKEGQVAQAYERWVAGMP